MKATANVTFTTTSMGTIKELTLPDTKYTILIHSLGYEGSFSERPIQIRDGSVLGQYNIGRIDLV